ncbi:XRE family transcriptional regulator [Desulfovibrio sp.]|uniref:helix-turn-helix domain-containing protein n=1 Tax=Desulfovibrio sp. TaxID=885 RepID=UPI0023C993BA|nr:XRE family transcriptional regulator [Desulfovibrio sp.]MDE7240673.1 XRE family transcriptional regulator [Desulfovibrio sp.]
MPGPATPRRDTAIGARVRAFREARGLTVAALAETTNLSPSFLAGLENGDIYPPIGTLQKVARALDVRLGTFLDGEESTDPVRARIEDFPGGFPGGRHAAPPRTDADAAPEVGHAEPAADMRRPGYIYQALGKGKSDRNMEPFCVEFFPPAPGEEPHLSSHQGEEFLLVLAGRLGVRYGRESYELSPGETIYYNSIVPHALTALDGEPARILGVAYNP